MAVTVTTQQLMLVTGLLVVLLIAMIRVQYSLYVTMEKLGEVWLMEHRVLHEIRAIAHGFSVLEMKNS
ncbi:MAG TPA: hypothetical protein VKD22_04485 [Ramlibacter sp.]|nr:hypothetical protein [Ramlibacter sp.]